MTDEENKAIKDCDSIFICLDDAMSEESANDYRKSYKILKNLIEKQSKEIEDNKKYIDLHYVPYEQYVSITNGIDKKWKDKIKAKIEEVDKDENASIPDFMEYAKEYAKGKLQSLLEKE